jgi:hypothetical protein
MLIGGLLLCSAECQQEIDQSAKFCPNCGTPQPPAAAPVSGGSYTQAQPAYIRPDYDPSRDGRSGSVQTAAVPTGGQKYGQTAPMPSATGQIVFSIINIVCCGGFVGTILGVIALVFAIMATSETSCQEADRKLKIAKILNIIGICFVALILIIIIISLVFAAGAGVYEAF